MKSYLHHLECCSLWVLRSSKTFLSGLYFKVKHNLDSISINVTGDLITKRYFSSLISDASVIFEWHSKADFEISPFMTAF